VKTRPAPPPVRSIRRYDNRKLYDVQARRYVTLEELSRLVARGEEVHVADQRTGEDITTVVLAQVVLESLKQRTASIPHQVLSRLIRLGSATGPAVPEWAEAQDAAGRARREAERIVSGLVARGRLGLDEALALRQEIAASAQRLITEAQAGVQARLRRLLEGTVPTTAAAKRPRRPAAAQRARSTKPKKGRSRKNPRKKKTS
jgi:polyhydroxyalkanoate synthesis repressor PhaR